MVLDLYAGSRSCRLSYTDEAVQWSYDGTPPPAPPTTAGATQKGSTTAANHRQQQPQQKQQHKPPPKQEQFHERYRQLNTNGAPPPPPPPPPPSPPPPLPPKPTKRNKGVDDSEDCGGYVPFHEVIAVVECEEAFVRGNERSTNGSKRSASVHPLFVVQKEACSQLETNGNYSQTVTDRTYQDDRECSFTLYYIKHYSGEMLGMASVTFQGPARLNKKFAKAVRDRMTISQNRPKHLLAFVSPKSGKNKGVKIFHNNVLPIFELAGIKVTELITERQRHAVDHLQTFGGDGMYSEVMNGLVLRTQKDAGVDPNRPGVHMHPCNLPIGIIPAVTIFVSMIKHAFYKMNVQYIQECDTNQEENKFSDSNSPNIDDVKMSNLSGDFHSVESWVVTLVKDGEDLTPMFGDSAGTVVVISKCGRLQHLKYLKELYKMKSVCYENNFIKMAKTLTYHIRFHQNSSDTPKTYLNCDGNAITAPSNDFSISVLQNVVSLFGKEPEMTITKL
ncbi:ceramide kinase-like isoform X1 [Octopus vulgaris]|nr:ceramide kinase-like isoform X1 [Octopus vulgaris]